MTASSSLFSFIELVHLRAACDSVSSRDACASLPFHDPPSLALLQDPLLPFSFYMRGGEPPKSHSSGPVLALMPGTPAYSIGLKTSHSTSPALTVPLDLGATSSATCENLFLDGPLSSQNQRL